MWSGFIVPLAQRAIFSKPNFYSRARANIATATDMLHYRCMPMLTESRANQMSNMNMMLIIINQMQFDAGN